MNPAREPEEWHCPVCMLDRGAGGAEGVQRVEELFKDRWQDDVYTHGSSSSSSSYLILPSKKANDHKGAS